MKYLANALQARPSRVNIAASVSAVAAADFPANDYNIGVITTAGDAEHDNIGLQSSAYNGSTSIAGQFNADGSNNNSAVKAIATATSNTGTNYGVWGEAHADDNTTVNYGVAGLGVEKENHKLVIIK